MYTDGIEPIRQLTLSFWVRYIEICGGEEIYRINKKKLNYNLIKFISFFKLHRLKNYVY